MQQISLTPSIFDLVPLTDISTPSRGSRDSETAAFEGILSTMMSSDKTAEQAGPRDEKAELDKTPKDREPEPSREEDSSSRGTDNDGSDSDEVREDGGTGSDDNESGDENAGSEKEQDDSNDEAREDEEAQGNNDETREDEEAQGNNDETREDEETQGNNEQGETAEEGQESGEPVGEIEIAAAIDQAAVLAGAAVDSGSGIEVVSMESEAQQQDQGEVGEDAERVAADNRQHIPDIPEQPVSDKRIPVDKAAVRQDAEVPVEAEKIREGASPGIKATDIVEKPTNTSVVKEEPVQAAESKTMPEISTEANVKEPAKDTGRWDTEGILHVHEARVKNTRTDEIQTDEAFRADESTQSGPFKEAPSPVMPIMKDVEVQLSLDTRAQTSTNSGTDAPKSVESKESFEVISTEASGRNVGNSGKTLQSGASRPASGRAFELERSVANQVIRGTLSTLRSGKNEMLLQLRPPELGNVRIRLTIENSIMAARIVVATENVRSMVERQLEYLRTSLAEEGIQVGRFEVQVGQQYGRQTFRNAWSEDGENPPGEGPLTSEEQSRHEGEPGGTQTNADRVRSENRRVYIVA